MLDLGTAYGRKTGTHDPGLTEVGAGTPMGELMRRYWLPVGLSSDATDLPKAVRALGEDLILFRAGDGRAGLVTPRCIHRGASLFYGRIESDCIRCPYHGWKFGIDGTCLDQPCEPGGGTKANVFRQPWYPVEERYGLIFAYLGPPAKKPLLPHYDVLEGLSEKEHLFTDDIHLGAGVPIGQENVPFNWLQHFENIHDPAHFIWLHYAHSGPQFGARFGEVDAILADPSKWVGEVQFEENANGVVAKRDCALPDGRFLKNRVETLLPCIRGVPNPRGSEGPADHLGFMLPVDDVNFRIFTVYRGIGGECEALSRGFSSTINQRWADVAADATVQQRFPNDWETQSSQGPITRHGDEHLVSSDRGIVMLRRLYARQAQIVADGGDPIGVTFAGDPMRHVEAGAFVSAAAI